MMIEVADFSFLLICKFRQYKVVNTANFVHYGKTQMAIPSLGQGCNFYCFTACTRVLDFNLNYLIQPLKES